MADIVKENYRSHKEASVDNRKPSNVSKNIGPYILGKVILKKEKTLGEGTFGKVKLGTHILTGEKVAVKILEKLKILEQSDKARVEREIKILKQLRHHNIIQIYQIIQTRTNLYLIMEYAPGDELFKYICQKKRLSEIEACKYFQQIISGVEYLHKLRIVHRDLKPENLLLDHNRDIKIVDFGLSNIYSKGELLKTPCGSPCYAAPEMIDGKRYSGLLVDIWSCGIILFAMICGFLPFDVIFYLNKDTNNDILYKKIIVGEFKIPSFVSDKARDLIKRILNTDPSQRYNIRQIKAHPWLNLVKMKLNEGLFISVHKIPIDMNVVKKMEDYGFEENEVLEHLKANKHDHITTTYYLILKKQSKSGQPSVADLISNEYHLFINDSKNWVNYIEDQDDKPKPNMAVDNIGRYSYSTPRNKESNKNVLDDSLDGKKSDKSDKIKKNNNLAAPVKEDKVKTDAPEVKKFVKIDKNPPAKKPIKNDKKLFDGKMKPFTVREKNTTPRNTISQKNSNKSEKKTTITINNINTNISINTTINIPENTDPSSIVINPNNMQFKKIEVISKESGKQDNFVKVIVNGKVASEKPRGIYILKDKEKNNNNPRKYNFQTNFIDTSTSFDFNHDRRNESFDINEKRSLRLEMNLLKKKEISEKNSKSDINNFLTESNNDEYMGKKSARTPNLKSEFQTINEDDEYKKSIESKVKNIKTRLLGKFNEKIEYHSNKISKKKDLTTTVLPKHVKNLSEISQIKQIPNVSRNDANKFKRTKKSDDHLSNTIKNVPLPIFNTIHINSKISQSKPSSSRVTEKALSSMNTPKAISLKNTDTENYKTQGPANVPNILNNTTITFPSHKNSNDFNQKNELRLHSDPFDMECISNRSSLEIREELLKVLEQLKIQHKTFGSNYRYRCSKNDVKFDIEICRLNEVEGRLLKFEKVEGTQCIFIENCSKVLSNMKLINS